MYEVFEHTADLGLRVTAVDLPTLFAEAGRGLFSLMVGNLADVRPLDTVSLEIAAEEREYLLFDWLNELLYRFETTHILLAYFDVQLSATGLSATALGERLDVERHRPEHEVKAITYHELKIEQRSDGSWLAEMIVDI